MQIEIDGIILNVLHHPARTANNTQSIVFLHGFSGSAEDWKPFFSKLNEDYMAFAIDLPGHGSSSSPDDPSFYTHESMIGQLKAIFDKVGITRPVLAGYSMGGRLALCFAKQHPKNVKALILESSSAGIQEEKERQIRLKTDTELAQSILEDDLDAFVTNWANLPLFASQKLLPLEMRNAWRERKLMNNKTGLANSLLGFSTGKMPNMWIELPNLFMPVLLMSGSLDAKFKALNSEMKQRLPHCIHEIVPQAGHNIHLEKPEVFINLVNGFLENLCRR